MRNPRCVFARVRTYERASKTENFSTGQKTSETDTTTDTTFLGNARKPYVYFDKTLGYASLIRVRSVVRVHPDPPVQCGN